MTARDEAPNYRVWFLGGVGEFGRNCTVIEARSGALLVIDAGLMFPGPDLPGVDRIVPDFDILSTRRNDVKALLITHGHEDHIGAISQFIDHVGPCEIYASPLALGLIERKLSPPQLRHSNLRAVEPLTSVAIGDFDVSFFSANHSIPQTLSILVGVGGDFLHFTGDFRLDDVPVLGHATDHRGLIDHLQGRRVRFMFVDSTNAGQVGRTRGEASVLSTLRPAVLDARGRVYFTTFASHLERCYLALRLAEESGRRVFVAGRAMQRNIELARKLGILNFPDTLFVGRGEVADAEQDQILVLASGSQGEAGSFLDQLSQNRQIDFSLSAGDLVIMSSVPIPGNEPRITRMIDRMMRTGAQVLHYRDAHVHVSGHARDDEIAAVTRVVDPDCLVPIHGDHYNLVRCVDAVRTIMKVDSLVLQTGAAIEVFVDRYKVVPEYVSARAVYVDDHSDDIPQATVAERRILRDQGAIVVLLLGNGDGVGYRLHDVIRMGYSGADDIEGYVRSALSRVSRDASQQRVIRACRDAIYRRVAGPRGRQVRIVVSVIDTGAPPSSLPFDGEES